MKLSNLSKLYALEQILMLFLKEAEKKVDSKWKSFIKCIKTVIYTLMVVRIFIAIYFKVKSREED
jgi:hypothetical protein